MGWGIARLIQRQQLEYMDELMMYFMVFYCLFVHIVEEPNFTSTQIAAILPRRCKHSPPSVQRYAIYVFDRS